jgi:putative ABC transport system permease protein
MKLALRFWRVSITYAWRDLRRARVLPSIAGIALGVATLTAVLHSTVALDSGLRRHTRELLGADISLRLFQPPTLDQMEALRAMPETSGVTLVSETTTMVLSAASPRPHIVSLKAVDPKIYPFYGTLSFTPSLPLALALDGRSALVDSALQPLLGIGPGGVINIAGQQFRVTGIIDSDSTRVPLMAPLPQVVISRTEYERSGLAEDTPALYHVLLRLPPSVQPESLHARLEQMFPSGGILDNREPDPGVLSALAAGRRFLSFTAFAALVLGALGVAAAHRTHLVRRMDSVAILKILGAPSSRILAIHWSQAMMIAVPGSLLGVALGLAAGYGLNAFFGEYLPASDPSGFHAAPLLEGFIAGVGSVMVCLWMPLVHASRVRPLVLLRRGMAEAGPFGLPAARVWFLRRLTRLPLPPIARHAMAAIWRPSGNSAGVLFVLTLGSTVLLTSVFLAQGLLNQMSHNQVYGK